MRSCTLPRGSILCYSCLSRHCRSSLPGTGFPWCLALLAAVLLSVQTRGNPRDGTSGAVALSPLAPGPPVSATALTDNPGSSSVLIINNEALPLPAPGAIVTHPTGIAGNSQSTPLALVIVTHPAGIARNSQSTPLALVIVTHPADIIDCEDHVVSFKVVISGGTDPVTYTWQRMRPAEPGFSDIPPGAPNISTPAPGTLRIDNVGGSENPGGTRYRVVITDPSGSVTSNDALLTVNEITDVLPSVAFPAKTNVILCEGTGFSYTVITSGTLPVAYQWKKYQGPGVWANVTDNAVISGAHGAVLTFTHPTPAESGQYKVNLTFHASGADCNVSSDSRIRVVTFLAAPVAPLIADPGTACLGLPPPLLTATPASGGSGAFLYQWQESPDGVTWSDIPGATSLTFQPPVLTAATWFRLVATDNAPVSCGNAATSPLLVPVTDCLSRHYRTTASGEWHDRTIWETSADGLTWGGTAWTFPTAAMRTITIREGHQVTVVHDLSVDQVTVDAGGAVTVGPGAHLTNTGTAADFTIRAGPTASGSLVVPGTFAGQVTQQVQLRTQSGGGDYHYFSPPVSGETMAGFIAGNTCGMPATSKVTGVWLWEEPLGDWQELTTLPGAVFSPGRGYNLSQASGAANDGLFSFRGDPVAAVSVPATSPYGDVVLPTATREVYDQRLRAPGRTASANWGAGGWNLLGNPYNAALRIADPLEGTEDLTWGDEFLEANREAFDPNYVAVYLYDGTADAYQYIGHNTGGWDEPAEGAAMGAIPPGQGFFILAMNNTSVFSFTPEMQLHAPALPLKSAQTPSWPGLRLTARIAGAESSTLVVFNEAMTAGLDPGYDIGLMSDGHDPGIFTTLVKDNGNWFARQALPFETGDPEGLSFESGSRQAHLKNGGTPDNPVIPVGINSHNGGVVTFLAEIRLPATGTFFLEDRKAGVFTDLKIGDYRVDLPPQTQGTGRFFLHYSANGQSPGEIPTLTLFSYELPALPWPTAPPLRIVARGNELLILGELDSPARYEIIDLSGRIIASGTIATWSSDSFPNSSQSSVSRAINSGRISYKSIVSTTPSPPTILPDYPIRLLLPRHHKGLFLVRITSQETNIVYKFLNNL